MGSHRALIIFAFLIALTSFISRGRADSTMDDLTKEIRNSEVKLRNVAVDSTYYSERWDDRTASWGYDGDARLTAWYVGLPGSLARIDFHKDEGVWIDGAAPFNNDVFDEAYNGRIGQRLMFETGDPKQPVRLLRGEVSLARAQDFGSFGGDACGWALSIYGIMDSQGKRLSSIFHDPEGQPKISHEKVAGVDCVKITQNFPGRTLIYDLDPKRGYALVQWEWVTPAGAILSKISVDEFLEPAPGIFYPKSATVTADLRSVGQGLTRSRFSAQKVEVNDPAFSNEIFTIQWPPGASIHDDETNKTTYVGYNDEMSHAVVEKQVARVRTDLATPASSGTPSRAMVPHDSDGTLAETAPVATPGARAAGWLPWAAALAICSLAVGAAIVFRRRRLRRGASLMFLAMGLGLNGRAFAQLSAGVMDDLGGIKVANCGVSTADFVLSFYGKPVDEAKLEGEPRVGAHRDRPVTFLDLKQSLEVRRRSRDLRRLAVHRLFYTAARDKVAGPLRFNAQICIFRPARIARAARSSIVARWPISVIRRDRGSAQPAPWPLAAVVLSLRLR